MFGSSGLFQRTLAVLGGLVRIVFDAHIDQEIATIPIVLDQAPGRFRSFQNERRIPGKSLSFVFEGDTHNRTKVFILLENGSTAKNLMAPTAPDHDCDMLSMIHR